MYMLYIMQKKSTERVKSIYTNCMTNENVFIVCPGCRL